jgi:hypothetical protein
MTEARGRRTAESWSVRQLGGSEWVPKHDLSRLGSQYRLQAVQDRVNAVLQTDETSFTTAAA